MSKKLLLIATGGTIASRPAEDGLTPEMTSEELLQCIPEVRALCRDFLHFSMRESTKKRLTSAGRNPYNGNRK